MPRQGVPYPSREICSLKCQIDALQRQINELMKSINGVEGDGQGNVSLISSDPAVIINNDAAQNQIEIALDQSQLPAAAVRMVNGMTGAVVLAANDIYAGANTVGFEIADLKAENLLRKQGITNEISNRQAADAALQANINALQASIPGEAAQAVANDPTVQGLVTADAQNVKLGGSQNITGVKTVPTEATGSATQQIANGAKVKNELDAYAPMVRTTGNQTIAGVKTFTALIEQEGPWPNLRKKISDVDITTNTTSWQDKGNINWIDRNGVTIAQIRLLISSTNKVSIQAMVRNANGTNKYVMLAEGNN